MVKLERLELELGAVLRLEHEIVVAPVLGHVLLQPGLVVLEQGGVAHRLFAVGAAVDIHLQEPEIHAELDLRLAIPSGEFPDDDLPRLIVPILEEVRDIEVHRRGVWRTKSSSQRVARKTEHVNSGRSCDFRFSLRRAFRNVSRA
jgi:hypothetical protein